MIGGFQYLTHTRPNTKNTIGIVAIFQGDLKESHYVAIKRIFKYLNGILDHGLLYDRSSDFTLCDYTDADWVGNMDDRKNTSDGEFFLGGRLISWLSKKHDFILEYNRSRVCGNTKQL